MLDNIVHPVLRQGFTHPRVATDVQKQDRDVLILRLELRVLGILRNMASPVHKHLPGVQKIPPVYALSTYSDWQTPVVANHLWLVECVTV